MPNDDDRRRAIDEGAQAERQMLEKLGRSVSHDEMRRTYVKEQERMDRVRSERSKRR